MIAIVRGRSEVVDPLATLLGSEDRATRIVLLDAATDTVASGANTEVVAWEEARPDALANGCETVLVSVGAFGEGLERALDFTRALDGRFRHVFLLSVLGAEKPEGLPVLEAHADLEDAIVAGDAPWTIVRVNALMQDLLEHAPTVAGTGHMYGCSGDGRVSYVHLDDVVEVLSRLLVQPPEPGTALALTGAEAYSHEDVAALLSETLESRVEYVDMPPHAFAGALAQAGIAEPEASSLAQLLAFYGSGKVAGISSVVGEVLRRRPFGINAFLLTHRERFARGR